MLGQRQLCHQCGEVEIPSDKETLRAARAVWRDTGRIPQTLLLHCLGVCSERCEDAAGLARLIAKGAHHVE